MSYQVLARQYRPRNFSTLVGQEHVVKALTHALDQQRLHHAYMFTGTRGVGKTTLSRILAKALNCIGPDGAGQITSTPCGVCEACVAIDAGRFVDYIEMDAASNRGVDEMAQLLEQAAYAPNNARFKVYMIDEVHMLTNHAFNAMLKTLEEPPSYVKFILATTDPQKIPVTVLSRCLQFNLKQMPPQHIVSHLENILGQEQIPFETGALRLLAKGAQGSMRDALSLTDQAIAYAAGNVSLEAVQGMLGALDQSYLISILDALAQKDGEQLLAVSAEMGVRSLSYSAALQDLATLLHQLAIAQTVPTALDASLPDTAELIRLAGLMQPEDVQLFYQIAVHGRQDLSLAPDEQAGFSMTLLRMLSFTPGGVAAPQGGGAGVRKTAAVVRPAAVPQAAPSATADQPTGGSGSSGHASGPAPIAQQSSAPAPLQQVQQVQPVAQPVQGKISPARAALDAARQASTNRSSAVPRPHVPVPNGSPANGVEVPVQASALPAYLQNVSGARAQTGMAKTVSSPDPVIRSGMPASQPVTSAPIMPSQMSADNGGQPTIAVGLREEQSADFERDFESEYDADYGAGTHSELSSQESVPVATLSASSAPVVVAPVASQADEGQVSVLATPAAVASFDKVEGWNGDWPALVGTLPLRGVVHQLAQQSELAGVRSEPDLITLRLHVPLPTLRSADSPEKLSGALAERFGLPVVLDIVIAPVQDTAQIRSDRHAAAALQQAETDLMADSFVQGMMSELGASIVGGSIRHGI